MNLHFVTYSDYKYTNRQKELDEKAKKNFILHSYTREWLICTEFYKSNKEILDLDRGGGYWLWKPYIILETLKKIENNDILFYLDCGDIFIPELQTFLFSYFENINNNYIFTLGGRNKQKTYTKRDCFILMNCDNEYYYEQIQLEAGILCFRKIKENIELVEEWLRYCMNKNILTDIDNITKQNLTGFIDHRHDQSILTNLVTKYNFRANHLLRKYIICNVNQ